MGSAVRGEETEPAARDAEREERHLLACGGHAGGFTGNNRGRAMILRMIRIERIDAYERAGWFWRWNAPHRGIMPGPHSCWSVTMEWLCDCKPGRVGE